MNLKTFSMLSKDSAGIFTQKVFKKGVFIWTSDLFTLKINKAGPLHKIQ